MLDFFLSYCVSEGVPLTDLYVCMYHDAYIILMALHSSGQYSTCAE